MNSIDIVCAACIVVLMLVMLFKYIQLAQKLFKIISIAFNNTTTQQLYILLQYGCNYGKRLKLFIEGLE